jgi:hypothetical protein
MTERLTASGNPLSLVCDPEPGDDLIAGPEVVDWQIHVQILQIGSRLVRLNAEAREILDREFASLQLELSRSTVRRVTAVDLVEQICETLTAVESAPASLRDVIRLGRLNRLGRASITPIRPAMP